MLKSQQTAGFLLLNKAFGSPSNSKKPYIILFEPSGIEIE